MNHYQTRDGEPAPRGVGAHCNHLLSGQSYQEDDDDVTDLEDTDGDHDLHHAAQEPPVVGGGDLSYIGGAEDTDNA